MHAHSRRILRDLASATNVAPRSIREAEDGEAEHSLLSSIRHVASVEGDDGFASLPPALMSDSPLPSDQLLNRKDAECFRAGEPPLLPASRFIGACVFHHRGLSHPVLLFADHEAKAVVANVYCVSVASLESELYRPDRPVSKVEAAWKGSSLAASHVGVLHLIGTHARNSSLSKLPPFFFSDDDASFHVARSGPIPLLHMRPPANPSEVRMLENATRCYFETTSSALPPAFRPDEVGETWKRDFDAAASSEYSFSASFSTLRFEKLHEEKEGEEDEDRLRLHHRHGLVLAYACVLGCDCEPASVSAVQAASELAIPSNSVALHGDVLATSLTRLAVSSKLYEICILGKIGSASQAHVVASAAFVEPHVGASIRDIEPNAFPTKPVSSARAMVVSLGKRVHPSGLLLFLELTTSREVRTRRVLNSEIDHEVGMDCAARLLDFPCVMPVGIVQMGKETASFFTLASSDVVRNKLCVCDAMRLAYAPLEQHAVRSPQYDFSKLDRIVDRLEEATAAGARPPKAQKRQETATSSATSPTAKKRKDDAK